VLNGLLFRVSVLILVFASNGYLPFGLYLTGFFIIRLAVLGHLNAPLHDMIFELGILDRVPKFLNHPLNLLLISARGIEIHSDTLSAYTYGINSAEHIKLLL
jgi:hypothetical protein